MIVRAIRSEEIAQIAALEREIFPDPWSEKSLSDLSSSVISSVLVGEEAGELVAYAVINLVADEGEIWRFATVPSRRRQGYGRAILNEVIRLCQQKGIQKILLEVRESNRAARALYEAIGFQEVGKRPKYYQSPVEGAILYVFCPERK